MPKQLDLDKIFFPQKLNDEQLVRVRKIGELFHETAKQVIELTPGSAEQTIVIRKLQEAKLLAVNSIAVNEEVIGEFKPEESK